MWVNNDIPLSRAKQGWYEVNGQRYLNKHHALEVCAESEWPQWNFNNTEYSQINWSCEPAEDIYDIYKSRALQLRQKYDFLLLYYSGGIDSHAVLRTFIDNNIPLDGIIITGSFSVDQSNLTCNQEQKRVAQEYISQLEKFGRLPCPVFYLDTVKYHKFDDENWVYACGQSLTPQVYSYNHFWQESWMQDFLMRGKTAFIRGVDKPRIIMQDGHWYASFIDTHIMSGTPTGMLKANQDWDIQEYFYWTPDMPEIVVKQSHIMIDWLESNMTYEEIARLTTKDSEFDRERYNNYSDPLVYGRYVEQTPGQPRPYFTLGKPICSNVWHKDIWFFKSRDVLKDEYDKWIAGLRMIKSKVHSNKFNRVDPKKLAELATVYNLDQQALDLGSVLFGGGGMWSKFYPIKPYQNRIIAGRQ